MSPIHVKSKKEIELLKTLKKLNSDDIKTILHFLDNDAIECIGECCYNVIFTNLSLNKKSKKRLVKTLQGKEKVFKQICNKNKPVNIRRKLLRQNGGFLSVIIATALPIIADLIYNAVKK